MTRFIPLPEQIDALGAVLSNLDEMLMTDNERAEAVVWAWEGMRGKGLGVRHTVTKGAEASDSCPLCLDERVLWSGDEQRCWPCSCAASADTHPAGGDATQIEAPAPLSGAVGGVGNADGIETPKHDSAAIAQNPPETSDG